MWWFEDVLIIKMATTKLRTQNTELLPSGTCTVQTTFFNSWSVIILKVSSAFMG